MLLCHAVIVKRLQFFPETKGYVFLLVVLKPSPLELKWRRLYTLIAREDKSSSDATF
jgi:hypothetical protein